MLEQARDMNQFVESLRRLCQNGMVDEKKIVSLSDNGKITNEEKDYILNTH